LTFAPSYGKQWGALAGISVDATVRADGATFRENLLFTHRGLSGPAVLQASSYWHGGKPIMVDLLPDTATDDLFPQPNREPRTTQNVLATALPRRVVDAWESPVLDRRVDQVSKRDLEALMADLHAWRLWPNGTEGYAKAEVTRGGVDTAELSQSTMECKRVPGLYFIGEIIDVTGWLGGYNFQWAWASGVAAGKALQ
jgi:predicted Rossmann fold flavoprotein